MGLQELDDSFERRLIGQRPTHRLHVLRHAPVPPDMHRMCVAWGRQGMTLRTNDLKGFTDGGIQILIRVANVVINYRI